MAQIKTGTVSVTNGSNVVTGSGTQFLTEGAVVGSAFIIQTSEGIDGAGVLYTIGGSITETGFQLSSNWAGETASGLAFVVHVDMLAAGFYQLLPGDLEIKTIFNYNITKLINEKAALAALGTAAFANLTASATDTTVGRVLKVDDFGVGSRKPTITDLNAATTFYSECAQTAANLPSGVIFSGGIQVFTFTMGDFSSVLHQTVKGKENATGTKRIFERTFDGTVWGSWQEVYTTGNVETTAQNLLDNGSYGFGQAAQNEPDLTSTSVNVGRIFRALASAVGGPPENGGVIALPEDGTPSVNFLSIADENNAYIGSKFGATATPSWKKLFGQGNILGTVSQSGGVPTGAIIERGSNAGGEYVKYADGTMICTRFYEVTANFTAEGNVFRAPLTSVSFPVPFSNTPTLEANPALSSDNSDAPDTVWCGGRSAGTSLTGWNLELIATRSGNIKKRYYLFAIGRWY